MRRSPFPHPLETISYSRTLGKQLFSTGFERSNTVNWATHPSTDAHMIAEQPCSSDLGYTSIHFHSHDCRAAWLTPLDVIVQHAPLVIRTDAVIKIAVGHLVRAEHVSKRVMRLSPL